MSLDQPFRSWRRLLVACATAAAIPVAVGLLGRSLGTTGTTGLNQELELRYLPGDSLRWRLPEYDDRHWIRSGQQADRESTDSWVRFELQSPPPPPPATTASGAPSAGRALGLSLVTSFAYDVYWNGQRIGSNVPGGSVSDSGPDFRPLHARDASLHPVPSSAVQGGPISSR